MAIFWAGGLPVFVVDLAVFVWQSIGAMRATRRSLDDNPDLVQMIAAYGAMIFVFFLFLWPQLDRWSAANTPLHQTTAPAEVGVTLITTEILLDGDISFAMFNALELAIATNPRIEKIHLDSGGGRVFAARGIARLISENALDTHVDKTCASACTLAFIAGANRTIGPSGRLGFHGYQLQSTVRTIETDDQQEIDKTTLLAAGIDAAFVDRIFKVPHSDMWFPTRVELIAAGVILD